MKKIIIVNNNMKIGGIQKSLCNLLWAVSEEYNITLYLFSKSGEYIDQLPPTVQVKTCTSLFRFLGVSQSECENRLSDRLTRGVLATLCKLFGRPFVMRLISLSQESLPEEYDVAISYLQNGNIHSFYGGINEFVLQKVHAKKKISFLHCDYENCGANHPKNNALYPAFDKIAACSGGCRNAFLRVMPELEQKCVTVMNFHRYEQILSQSKTNPVTYEEGRFHVVMVCRLAHEKGIERAIQAISHVNRVGIPTELHIVGDGPMKRKLIDVASEYNGTDFVHLYGEQSNPYRYMCNADLLLITSFNEAAPMIIDEAYCLGIPILSTATTSAREMILERGCGWVCENSQISINQYLKEILLNRDTLKYVRSRIQSVDVDNKKAINQFAELIGK